MKKVFIIIDDITNVGGTERVASLLCNQLVDIGYDITLCSLGCSKKQPAFELNPLIALHTFEEKNRYLSILSILSQAKKDNSVIIVISMGRLSVEVIALSKLTPSPKIILSEHTTFSSFSLLKRIVKKFSYSLADKVVFLTNHDKELVSKKNKFCRKFLTISNINPFHDNKLNLRPLKERENIAIAIGRFGYEKNFERLISIWKKAKIQNWKLIIIGDGCQNLESLIKPSDNILTLPPSKEISSYYNRSKLVLMTSRYEGLPMVLIEAQYFGVPAIAFDCKTGPREIISDEENGFLISYENDNDFIEKLRLLTSNDKLLYKMHIKSKENSYNYAPENIIPKWQSIIED